MAKEKKYKKIINKIVDSAASVITFHDRVQLKLDKRWPVIKRSLIDKTINGAASIITFHDKLQARADRRWLIINYNCAKKIHKERVLIAEKKKDILSHLAIAVLVAIAVVALFNHATGYQYSYNGRALGYVKNQEDVTKILGLVSEQLSKEHGSSIKIDAETDITFKNVVVLDKEIDDEDTVLKRLTYLTDMEAKAYGIYVDGRLFTICESKEAAKQTLKNVQEGYVDEDDNTKYEKIGFVQDVKIKKINTKLPYIRSVAQATKAIMNGGTKETVYKVKKGDTYSEIFKEFDTTFKELKKLNPDLKMTELFIDQKIIMNKATSALTVKTVEISTFAEKYKYKTVYKKSSSMYKGDTKVIQHGSSGKRVVTARLTRVNGEVVDKDVLESETIKKSVKKIVLKGTKAVPKTAPTGHFILPVSGYSLTSTFGYRWGRMHEGVDLACGTGTTIRASDGGTVVYAGWYSGYGNFIEIDHGNGLHSRYGHCNSINVSVGEKVYQGQKIGEVGNTGNSYGSHCHFEITVNGSPVNPLGYV